MTAGDVTDEIAVEESALDDNALEVTDDVVMTESDENDGIVIGNSTPTQDTNVVTKDTFYNYFDESGSLLENVTSDELIFNGDFSNINVSYITIDKPIKFTGNDVAFTGVTFVIGADDVTVDGFTLTQSDVYLFYIEGTNNVTLSNNILNFNAIEGFDGYAVYANAVSALNLINNTITYVGTTDGTVRNNAIRISGDEDNEVPATDILVQGNIFNIRLPSVDVYYDPYTYEASIQSEGIAFYYCDGVEFIDNNLFVWHTENANGFYDTIYGVGFRGNPYNFDADEPIMCYNVVVANNEISASGINFMYALCISADGFEIYNNTIDANSLNNYADAIAVDGPSCDGEIYNNQINVLAPEKAYGIYSYQYMGAIEDISYYNNNVTVIGYAACGMELVEYNTVALNNTITARGNYTYGIVASIRDEGEFSGNKIYSLGNNNGTASTGDPLMPFPSMGITVKGDALISFNEIESTGIAVNIVKDSEVTLNNNNIALNANEIINAYAIYAVGVNELNIINNNISYAASSNGAVFTNVIRVSGDEDNEKAAKDISVLGNTFDIKIPSVPVYYDPGTWESSVMSEGIVFYYCEDVKFENNNVALDYNNASGMYDTIYVVSVRGNPYNFDAEDPIACANVDIVNNTINAKGHGYIYGIRAAAKNLDVSKNTLSIVADDYYACGIDIEGTSNGDVKDNDVFVISPGTAYGIYSSYYDGAVENMTYDNNTVLVQAYAACGIELLEINPIVSNNVVTAEGNYTYGIVASIVNNGTISGNTLSAMGSNVGNLVTGDTLLPFNSMGLSVKGSTVIKNNDIKSSDYGVNLIEEGGITLENNNITVNTIGDVSSYGIYAYDLNDLEIINNNISYVGNTNGTFINNAIRVSGNEDKERIASHILVEGNTLDISIPSVPVYYDPYTYEATTMSEGIVFYYCELVEFVNNDVTLNYNDASGYYDTIYVLSVRGNPYNLDAEDPIACADVIIRDNNITAKGHGYIYGIFAAANDLEVSYNNLNISADDYYANAIDIEGPSNGNVHHNNITVSSPGTSYGIYSSTYNGAVQDMGYFSNNVLVDAYAACGIELLEKNPVVLNNNITATGNYTYGIVASITTAGEIIGNNIVCAGSEVGNTSTGDSLLPYNSIGIGVKSVALVKENTVVSTDMGINAFKSNLTADNNTIKVMGDYVIVLEQSNATVTNNYLTGKKGVGNGAIIGDRVISVSGNTPLLKIILLGTILNRPIDLPVVYRVLAIDENEYPVANITISAIIDGVVVNATTDEKGIASFDTVNLGVGTYNVSASFAGNDVYGPNNCEGIIFVNPRTVFLYAIDVNMTYGDGTKYNVIVFDHRGPYHMTNVTVFADIGGIIFNATTDENGVASFDLDLGAGNYTVVASFAGSEIYAPASINNTIVINPQATKFVYTKTVTVLLTAIKKGTYYKITLKDSNGKALANKKVTINFNGKTYTKTTDSNGLINFKLAATKVGNQKLTMTFAGDQNYTSVTQTATIKIIKEATKLVVPATSFKVNTKTKVVKVTLKDSKNKGVGGVKVTLRVNGVTYSAKTVSTGVAAIKVTKLNKVGSFSTIVKFAGNNYYKAVSKATKISVKK